MITPCMAPNWVMYESSLPKSSDSHILLEYAMVKVGLRVTQFFKEKPPKFGGIVRIDPETSQIEVLWDKAALVQLFAFSWKGSLVDASLYVC